MHSLIIIAHPSAKGFSRRIAETYKAEREKNGHSAMIIDLYDPQWKQEFLAYQDEKELSARGKELNAHQKEIRKADELVFAFPVWWFDVPAILKNFLDQNFASGFAFEYSKRGIKGLLKGKTVRLFSTSGGPALIYKLKVIPYATSFIASLRSCGIKVVSKTIFGGRRGSNPELEQKWLEEVRQVARK